MKGCECNHDTLFKRWDDAGGGLVPQDLWTGQPDCRNRDLHPNVRNSGTLNVGAPAWKRPPSVVDEIAAQLAWWLPAPPSHPAPTVPPHCDPFAALRVLRDVEQETAQAQALDLPVADLEATAVALRAQLDVDIRHKHCVSASVDLRMHLRARRKSLLEISANERRWCREVQSRTAARQWTNGGWSPAPGRRRVGLGRYEQLEGLHEQDFQVDVNADLVSTFMGAATVVRVEGEGLGIRPGDIVALNSAGRAFAVAPGVRPLGVVRSVDIDYRAGESPRALVDIRMLSPWEAQARRPIEETIAATARQLIARGPLRSDVKRAGGRRRKRKRGYR